ncbi:hypothetical protein GGF42_000242 [Coemansia sp. RSA 2424]|nr:hypothetical protein GGF42_000242 [Coemansia sp. RSA 2424]
MSTLVTVYFNPVSADGLMPANAGSSEPIPLMAINFGETRKVVVDNAAVLITQLLSSNFSIDSHYSFDLGKKGNMIVELGENAYTLENSSQEFYWPETATIMMTIQLKTYISIRIYEEYLAMFRKAN